jgi:hypothetical protein
MGELKNVSKEEVLEIISTMPLEPVFNKVFITINTVEVDGELVLTNDTLSEDQYVLAVGPTAARTVSPGDKVVLDLEKMTVRTPLDHDQTQVNTQIKIDPIYINGRQFAIVNDNCFKAKYK